jgi:hypothetical protein
MFAEGIQAEVSAATVNKPLGQKRLPASKIGLASFKKLERGLAWFCEPRRSVTGAS